GEYAFYNGKAQYMNFDFKWSEIILAPIPTKEKPKMKYESLKDITLQALHNEGACSDKLAEVARRIIADGYAPNDVLPADYTQEVAESIDEAHYLVNHGFIREVKEPKPEVFYHVGQRFDFDAGKHVLHIVGVNKVQMLALNGKSHHGEAIDVQNSSKITAAEFEKITYGAPDKFTPLEGT
ncbi:MAG: hypothetical protein KKE05_00420, partial [Nanoarchaeota archaeon]|nr:hypothetical protein [Nanoarchaeota archaeon]